MKYFYGCILAGAAVLIWGSQNTVLRFLYGENPSGFDPYSFAFVRNLAGSIFLLLLVFFRREWNTLVLALRKHWKSLAALAAAGIALKACCQIGAPMFTTAARASLFGASAPVFTLLFARIFLKEKVNVWQVSGILCGLGGIAVALFSGGLDRFGTGGMIKGDLIAFAGGVLWGLYNAFCGKVVRECGGVVSMAAVMLIGTVLLFIPVVPDITGMETVLSGYLLAGVIYLGVVSIGVALLLWAAAAKILPAATLGTFGYVSLLLSMVFSHLLLAEQFSGVFLLAVLLMLAGTMFPVLLGNKQ